MSYVQPAAISGPRPQPVVDAQRITAGVLGVFGAVMTVLAALGVTVDGSTEQTITALLTGLGTLLAIVLPLVQARKAAALVTPVSDPRDNTGAQLVPAGVGGAPLD